MCHVPPSSISRGVLMLLPDAHHSIWQPACLAAVSGHHLWSAAAASAGGGRLSRPLHSTVGRAMCSMPGAPTSCGRSPTIQPTPLGAWEPPSLMPWTPCGCWTCGTSSRWLETGWRKWILISETAADCVAENLSQVKNRLQRNVQYQ